MAVYKSDTLIVQSIYGSSRLGLINYASKTGYRSLGGKKYELSNHLGNVLAVVSDNIHLDQDSTWTSLINTTDYYPFGLAMDGRSVQDSAYRFGFNGQEIDNSFGLPNNDYGERIYNPEIGRFLSADPLIVKQGEYPELSAYQFASLTPIQAIDLDGLEGLIVIRMDKPPTNFNKILFASELQKRLVESGAHKDTRVVYENSKDYKEMGAWKRFWDFKSNQSATITFRNVNIVSDVGHTDAGGYGEDGEIVIFRGLTGIKDYGKKDRELPTWLYVNVALHEIGHAVYDFFGDKKSKSQNGLGHNPKGASSTGTDLMDYGAVIKQDTGFSEEQKKVIKVMAGEDEKN